MKILGFYIGGHDSNVSMVEDNGRVKYFKLERLVQSKHKKGNVAWIKQLCEQESFYPDYICFSDGNRNGLGICHEKELFEQSKPIEGLFEKPTYCIDHHYAHILSTWPVVENDYTNKRIIGICIDGRGDHNIKCSVIKEPFDLKKAKFIYSNKNAAYCLLFNEIGHLMKLDGGELDYAGKIMGANAYGNVDNKYINQCEKYIAKFGVEGILSQPFRDISIEEICKKMDSQFYDWIATVHKVIGDQIFKLFETYASNNEKVLYSGGAAQNTVYNEMLSKSFDITIPPHCYDGGISIGCVKFIALMKKEKLYFEQFPFEEGISDVGYANKEVINIVANQLKGGKIIAWCQGKSEIGPRALGHRSIIMNPAIKDGKNIINQRVKKREYWRPFAASILREDANTITGKNRDFTYMLHATQVEQEYAEIMKSVIHVDGTCRFQTVQNKNGLESFYELIKTFKKITGIPGVLNTSFNLSGQPIVDSFDDIIYAFHSMDIDLLCVGNQIYGKNNDGKIIDRTPYNHML